MAERILAEQAALEARAAPDGERKTITALFADINGSMEIIEDLDPEEARRLIDPALDLMMEAVHRCDGYVAQALGDGIFALFGTPIAHEDYPQRALYAALRMHLAKDLKPIVATERVFEGVPIKTPQLDIVTIGAGGGSIAWVDAEGGLKVGPQSAGAQPGPVCYGQGGTEVTVTDANLILGRLGAFTLLGGAMGLDKALSAKAMETLGQKVNVPDIHRLAEGIIKICINHMCGVVRALSIERGHDPRDFTLIPIGGAGAMHAVLIAEELGIARVLVPNNPGNACALGPLTSDLKHDYVRTYVTGLREADLSRVRGLLQEEMEAEGRRALLQEGIPGDRIELHYSADLCYLGQSWQLNTVIHLEDGLADMEKAFHDLYEKTYGYSRKEMVVELVYLRVVASGGVDKPVLRPDPLRYP